MTLSGGKIAEIGPADVQWIFKAIGEAIDYGVWICDADGRNIYASDSFLRLIGLTQKECSDYGWGAALHPDEAPGTIAAWKECVRTGGFWDREHRFKGVDGKWHTVLARGTPVRNEHGEIVYWAGINLDISKLKKVESALRESDDRFKAFMNNSVAIAWMKDEEGRYVYVNRPFETRFNLPPEKVIGKTDYDLWSLDIARNFSRNDLLVLSSGQGEEFIEQTADADGGTTSWWNFKFPFRDAEGRKHVGGMGIDITERQQAEEILKRDKETLSQLIREQADIWLTAQVELERAKRLSDLGSLASTVAHELRNPLAAINLAVVNIRKKSPDRIFESHLRTIEHKILESRQIIDNLLFYARLRPPMLVSIRVYDILKECVDDIRDHAAKKISVTDDFGSIREISLQADPLQIKEVFQNVLNNAYDAVSEGHGAIEIAAQTDDDSVRIMIRDNGCGIKKDVLPRIFDPFFSTKAKGTGLGLPVCRQIIDMHDGKIGIESETGKGTNFTITLPRGKDLKKKTENEPFTLKSD